MRYLICDKCGGYYELQEGESHDDYSDACECGGRLHYKEFINENKHNKSLNTTQTSIESIIPKIISFWNNQSKNRKILMCSVLFILIITPVIYSFLAPNEYTVGTSKFEVPYDYYNKVEYHNYYSSNDCLELGSYYNLSLKIIEFPNQAKMDKYMNNMFINPETINNWNCHSNLNAYTTTIYTNYATNINGINVQVFKDRIFPMKNYFFEKNGKYYFLSVFQHGQYLDQEEDKTVKMIIKTMR